MTIFRSIFALLLLAGAVPSVAQEAAPRTRQERPRTILFVGNSFTQGAHSAVKRYAANTVTDLNGDGYGGVPALFKAFTEQAGLAYSVSLETQGGKTLGFHYTQRRAVIDRAWDVVVLQELSTLDRDRPGDATAYRRDVPMLAQLFLRANPAVDIRLMATWTRADLTYKTPGPWLNKPVTAMARDLQAAAAAVRAATPAVSAVIPVGEAWSRAMASGIADPDPYDGIAFGQVDLWTYDHYHASIYGYYLEALVVFGQITGVDPRTLGSKERAADDLGLAPEAAAALQAVAHAELLATAGSSRRGF